MKLSKHPPPVSLKTNLLGVSTLLPTPTRSAATMQMTICLTALILAKPLAGVAPSPWLDPKPRISRSTLIVNNKAEAAAA
jgi:hypothetical protein